MVVYHISLFHFIRSRKFLSILKRKTPKFIKTLVMGQLPNTWIIANIRKEGYHSMESLWILISYVSPAYSFKMWTSYIQNNSCKIHWKSAKYWQKEQYWIVKLSDKELQKIWLQSLPKSSYSNKNLKNCWWILTE